MDEMEEASGGVNPDTAFARIYVYRCDNGHEVRTRNTPLGGHVCREYGCGSTYKFIRMIDTSDGIYH